MKILAVDLGDARTGIACCDALEMLASPVGVIWEKDKAVLLEKIAVTVAENKAQMVVLGYPKNMNNTVGERAKLSEEFAEKLRCKIGVPVILWDERGTTVTAIDYLNKTNTRGEKRKNVVDALAATIILENYLEWRKNHPEKEE